MTFPTLTRIVNLGQLNDAIQEILPNAPDGSSASPAIAFEGDQTTGIYRNNDGFVVLTHKGKDVLAFDPAGLSFVVDAGTYLPDNISISNAFSGVSVTPQMFDPSGLIAAGKSCDSCIADALKYLGQNGGGVLKFPRGFYNLSNAITIPYSNIWLVGEGHGSTVLTFEATTPNQTGIQFVSNASDTAQYRGGCTDMSLVCQGATQASGAGTFGISTDATDDLYFCRLSINGFANGVGIIGTANTVRLHTIDVSDVQNDAFYVSSPTSQYFDGCTAYQNNVPTGAGFHIQKTGGFQMVNCVTGGSSPSTGKAGGYVGGILIDPPNGSTVQDGQIVNCNFDDSQIAGVNIDTSNGGNAINLDFVNARIGWGSRFGIAINGVNTSGIKFFGGAANRNLEHGVLIEGGYYIEFHGFHSRGNSVGTPNTCAGFTITGGDFISIIGGMSGPYAAQDSSESYSLTQQYGIDLASTFSGVLRVIGTDLRGNLTAPVINSTSAADIRFSDCIGYTTSNWGSSILAANSTSVTFAHGLSGAPSNVLLTYPETLTGISWHADSTNLTIDVQGTVTEDTTVNWQVRS